MMEIGEFIEKNAASLLSWGESIRQDIERDFRSLLKVPANVRVKEVASARVKQIKKNYARPTEQMTDLVGVRFVVLTSDDIPPIVERIQKSTAWDAKQARDPEEERNRSPLEFGYQSYHFEVRQKVRQCPESKAETPLCCEVQVRTLLQHAYAEFTHDTLYKGSQRVPSQAERLVARSMALMETTDELLCNAVAAVRAANYPVKALQEAAERACGNVEAATPQSILDEILTEYADLVSSDAHAKFEKFIAAKPFLVDRIQNRRGAGLFMFPVAAAITYWFASELENDIVDRWPLPTTTGDVKQILSDLGISAV